MLAWATDIAKLMGATPVGSANPDGITVTHDKLASPADGMIVAQMKAPIQVQCEGCPAPRYSPPGSGGPSPRRWSNSPR